MILRRCTKRLSFHAMQFSAYEKLIVFLLNSFRYVNEALSPSNPHFPS